ncbi:flagellar hook protein FlgE [Nesterenkonia halotolerans]|uniref:Flagellar hook protein FlgE n=1 Tax=Nesterenkonia halotolerans TaxID=225325 RepID=A0ABR9J627_9MICC|nr:flagellar hook protein FlgE [Nesterenkonia halotolerans]MBE1514456.1 flagellar hook protein FlgE [Nesterenkonia halotolerans]
MLRSLNSGISGLRSHQTMLDTTGNNIANVNTSGFKSQSTQFQDTLSQMTQGARGAAEEMGGGNPAQVGLGVQVAGTATNFTQGSAQSTGRATDMMISGDGFFVLRKGGQEILSRAGTFDFDAQGRLVSPDGGIVQGRMAANGQLPAGGALQDIVLPVGLTAPGTQTTSAAVDGNLPSEAAVGTTKTLDREIFNADGSSDTLQLSFTRTGTGWNVAGPGVPPGTALTQNADGTLDGGNVNVGGVDVDLTGLTGYAGLDTASIGEQNGTAAGVLQSYTLGADGTLTGRFSNGAQQPIAQIMLGQVGNPAGLEKLGSSGYTVTANSGALDFMAPGAAGVGTLAGGMLEMSNVDLSQEFTNLIVAQRGFQANARIITTSDEVLQELTNLKR